MEKIVASALSVLLDKLFERIPRRRSLEELVELLRLASGAHRVMIMKVTNGGSSLSGEKPMYITALARYEDERYVKRLPEITRLEIDEHFRAQIRLLISHEIVQHHFGLMPEGSQIERGMARAGVNYSELRLIKNSIRRAYYVVLSTAEYGDDPFRARLTEIDAAMAKVKERFK